MMKDTPEKPFVEVEANLEKAGRVEELIRLYEQRSREVPEPEEAGILLARAGELARERLRMLPRAEELFRRALVYAPSAREALEGLRALYEQRQDAAGLADVLERLAGASTGPAAAALYLKAAELYETKLSRRDRAVLCCQLAARAAPQERQAFDRARRLLLAEGRFRPAFDSLERERAAVPDRELLDEYLAFAEALIDDPHQQELARHALARVKAVDAGNARALALEKALDALEGSWKERVRQLRSKSLEERDRRQAARQSLTVAKLMYFFDPGQPAKAKEAIDRCFLLWPAMPDALELLERVAEKAGDFRIAVAIFSGFSKETKDKSAKVDLLLRAGTLQLTRLDDRKAALDTFSKAFELDPGRADAAGLASELLFESDRTADGVALLEKHLATLKDKVARASLHLRLASLLEREKNAAGARGHLEAAIALEPHNARTALRLAWAYANAGQLEPLWKVLELAASAPVPGAERVSFCEAAAMLFHDAGAAERAFTALALALPLEPGRAGLLESLGASAAAARMEPQFAAALRRAAQVAKGALAAPLWRALAQLQQGALGKSVDAQDSWLEVQKLLPNDALAAEQLGLIRKSLSAESEDPRARLEAEARKLEAQAADPAAAAAVYRKILEIDPSSVATLKKLGTACANLSAWEETAQIAERLMALADRLEDRQEWRLRLAQLYAERLARKDEAARLYLGLLSEGLGSAPVLGGLERLAAQGVRQAEISRALAPHYQRAGDHQRQVASLLVQLGSVQELAEQKGLLTLLAEVTEGKLLDPRQAFELRLRGLLLDPSDSNFRAEAARLARELKTQSELSRQLLELAARTAEPALARALASEAADLAQEAGAIDAAAAALKTALQRTGEDPALFQRLVSLFMGAGRPGEAVEPLKRLIELSPPEARASKWVTLAQLSRELGSPREAALALQEAIAAGANEAQLLPQVAADLEAGGRTAELVQVLGRLMELYEQAGQKDQASQLALRRARLMESLGDTAEAVRRYAEVLSSRPQDPEALAALEKLMEEPRAKEEAARALLPLYEAARDYRKMVSALQALAEATPDAQGKVAVLKQAAALHGQHLRQPEQAFASLAAAVRVLPGDLALRALARDAAAAADLLDSYAEELEELATNEQGGGIKLGLHAELAELYEKKLPDAGRAVNHLEAVLKLEPGNLAALQGLMRLHRAREEWFDLVPVLERLSGASADPAEKTAYDREAATLAEQRLNDLDRAAINWRQIAARDVLARDAAAALDRLYTTRDRPHELAFALELRRNQEGQSQKGRELAFRLAHLRQKLGDGSGALQLFRQILTEDSAHEGSRAALEAWARSDSAEAGAAIEVLDPVLAQSGEHARRIALREARLASAAPAERSRLSAEIRAIQERDLGQPDAAFMSALKAFTDGVDREAVRPELERLARETGQYEELAEIYETTASELDAQDPDHLLLLRRAAELREQLNQVDDAVRDWQAVLALAPQEHQALDALGRLFEKSQNAKSLSEVFAKKAQLATDPAERLELLLKAGEAYEAAPNDEAAVETYKAALALKKGPQALVALDRLFGRLRRHDEQAEVLDQLSSIVNDEDQRRGYMLRRAQLLEREARPLEALRGYANVLELSPSEQTAIGGLERLLLLDEVRSEAARVLEPAYRKQRDARRLVEVLEVRLQVSDASLRVALLSEIALLRELLGQKPLAFAARLRAFAEQPDDDKGREELERLAADLGNFEELAASYEDLLERGAGEPLAGELWRRLAVVYGERLERPDLAANAWNQVLARDPKNVFVLDALARLYRKSHDFKELALTMRRQLALETNLTAQINLLFELATLAEESLADKPLAAQCYQAILERKPDDPSAMRLLTRVLSETERYAELAALLQREVQLAEEHEKPEEALELMVRLGRLKLGRLGDPRGALEQFKEVLRRKPAHAGAVGALEDMARSDNSLKGEAASTLEPVFAKEGEHQKLVEMLQSRLSTETDAEERAGLHRRISEVYAAELGNPTMAFLSAANGLRDVPDSKGLLEQALALVDRADTHDELIEVLTETAPRAAADDRRIELYRALARLQAQNDDTDGSVESWKRVLELSPQDTEALENVGRLLGQAGRAPELLEVLKRQLAFAEEAPRRVGLMFQMGALQMDYLKDAAGALGSFRRVLELDPQSLLALERMDRLCEAQQRWPELADVLARRTQLLTGDAQLEARFRLALVRETRLLDKAGAVELYAELLQANPRNPAALERLEPLVVKEPQNASAVEALLVAYRAAGEHEKLARLIDARVVASPDAVERKTLLSELAALRDAQAEPELAYLALWRAFKEDPNDAELRARFIRGAEHAKNYDELVSALEEQLPRLAEAGDTAEVCLKIAELQETRLGELERAAQFYEKAREQAPEVSARALPALDRVYGKLNRAGEQANVLEALAQAAEDPQEKVGLLFRLGQLSQEYLEEPDRAAAAFEQVLAIDPRHLPSLRSLEALYEEAKSPEKLYRILQAQKDLVQGPERERVLSRMAVVSAEGQGDIGHSIDLYQELLAKNPRSDQAFQALDALLDRARRYDELTALLEGKLKVTVDPRELVRLNERLGRVLFERLGRPEDAIPFFKAALERDARHKGALEALRDIFEALGRKDDLVIVLRRLIPLQEEASGVKALRIRLAEVLAQGNRREEALDAARRALEVDPHQVEELERIHAVFLHLKAFQDAVRALELKSGVLAAADDREGAVQPLFQIADLWRGAGNKPESAGPALERVLEIDPANRNAYEQALQLYQQVNDWRAYAAVLERFLPNLVTDEEKLASLRELAKVREQKLGQKDVAFLTTLRALQHNPSDDGVREDVERLAFETGSFEELAAAYDEVADNLPRGPLAERLYLTLARVQDQKLDDLQGAESSLRKILEFDPTNEVALDALASMFNRRGKDQEYVVALEQKLEAAGSIERRKEILKEIARVYAERLGNSEEAAGALHRALELEADQDTLQTLVALQRGQKDHASVASSLLRMRDLAPTPEERSRIQVEVAQLYERDLGDDEAAVEGFRQALEFDPANTQALDALEQLYTRLDRPAELLAVYERQLELSSDYRERVKVLFKSAAIWEDRYQNLANADACIDAVLQVDPQNLPAIKSLERLRKAQGRWDELIGVVDRHIQLLTHPNERAELLVEMGDIFHQQLKQVDRAVTTYHTALELNPKCRPAMHALGTLYERSGNWPFALEMLEREAQAAGETPEAVELWHRMGKINEDMLIDPTSAKRCYLEALKIDAGYLPVLRSLRGIYEMERDWVAFERTLIQEAEETNEVKAKSVANLEVARFFSEHKEDKAGSTPYFEEALRLDPESVDAARPLADLYIAAERWDAAEKMLDIVVRRMSLRLGDDQDGALAREVCRQQYRLGYVCEKLGRKEKALDCYRKAYELDSTYLPALEGLGNLLVFHQKFEESLKVYQTILIHHRDDLTDLEVVEIYWTLGDVHLQLKQTDRAQNHFEKALSIDPGHEPSLRSMVAITEGAQQFEKAAEFRQRLLNTVEGPARVEVALALGKLAREQLNDKYMAIDAYLAAHREAADNVEVMDSLYILYRETKQGQKAAEMLEKMLAQPALKADPSRAKRVWFALGEIARDELNDVEAALRAFNHALDTDFRFIEAFSALEALLGRAKMWKQLEDNYVRMIQRLPKGEETHAARMHLWRALGDMYLKVLKRPEAAVEVYKVVAAGLPEDSAMQELFGELAAQQPGYEDSAVEAFRRALPTTSSPGKIASALAELAAKKKNYDSAWLAAQVSVGLIGEPGPGEREILTKLTPYAKKKEVAQRALGDRQWQTLLFHPKVRGPISELMAILFEQAGSLYKEDFTRYGINPKKHLIDTAASPEYQITHHKYVARVLGMEQVSLYSPFLVTTRDRMAKKTSEPAPDPMVSIEICHTHPVCLKVGGKFFSETGQKEVYYLLGRNLALLRPELAMSHWVSAERLLAIFEAAISLSVDRFRFQADPRAIEGERKLLERSLSEQARSALARVTREYVKQASPNDLRNYLEGAELTATRAGLFVAGEIEPVKRMVLNETGAQYRVQARSKIRDLMVFALGDDLHALRTAVGTQVEVALRR